MTGGALVRTARPRELVLDSRAETIALATFAEDKRALQAARGLGRRARRADRLPLRRPADDASSATATTASSSPAAAPSTTSPTRSSVLAGVHRGFVPVAPSAAAGRQARVEHQLRGRRALARRARQRRSDRLLQRLLEPQGLVHARERLHRGAGRPGVQRRRASRLRRRGAGRRRAAAPRRQADAADRRRVHVHALGFQHAFSSDFAGWGDVEEGDELPYLPRASARRSSTARQARRSGSSARPRAISGETRDVAGQGEIPEASAPRFAVHDRSLRARALARVRGALRDLHNLLDEQVIISRRPYGARPNAPRMFAVGYKARF